MRSKTLFYLMMAGTFNLGSFFVGPHQVLAVEDCREKTFANLKEIPVSLPSQKDPDGDTLRVVYNGLEYYVRFLSIDTPETHVKSKDNENDPNLKAHREAQKKWGLAAKTLTQELLAGSGELVIEFDDKVCDTWHRILGYVRKNNVMINRKLLEAGLAVNFCVWSTHQRCEDYSGVVENAIRNKIGMWAEYGLEHGALELPYDFRTREGGKGEARYIGSLRHPGSLFSFDQRGDIPIWDRVMFLKERDISNPYFLGERK